MDNEEMNLAELLKQTAEENQTRKILAILEESESLEDAKEKVKALLNKQGEDTKAQTRGQKTETIPATCPQVFLLSQQEDRRISRGKKR